MREAVIWKLLDLALAAVQAGFERQAVVEKVRELEAAGASPDQITDALQAMAKQSEADAQAAIDATRSAQP